MKFTMNQKILLGGVLGFLALTALGVYEALHDGEAERRVQEDVDKMFKDLTREELEIKRESEETKKQIDNLMKEMMEELEKYNSMVDEKHKIDFTKLN